MGGKLFCSNREVFKLAQGVQDSTKQVTWMAPIVWGTCPERSIGLFQKNANRRGGWKHGISMGVEKRACGNWRGQFKSKFNFQGCLRKTHVESKWVLIFDFGVSNGCHTILQNLQGWKIVFSGISKGKVTNLRANSRGIPEKYILKPPGLDFFWNMPLTICQDKVFGISIIIGSFGKVRTTVLWYWLTREQHLLHDE